MYIFVSTDVRAEEDESERSSAFPQMLEEEKVEGRRRDGDFDGTHRPQSGVKGFENEWVKWGTVALVWREDEQSEGNGWKTTKRFHSTFFPCTLIDPQKGFIYIALWLDHECAWLHQKEYPHNTNFCFVNMVKENEGDPANQSETCGVAWILEPEMRGKLGKDEC